MRNVQDIDPIAFQKHRHRPVVRQESVAFRLVELPEIRGKRAQFVKMALSADQPVFIPGIERGDVPDEVPDIGANPELIDLPDIYRNSHTV